MTLSIPLVFLFDPSTTNVGKFYIGVEDPKNPFALHGPNNPNAAGTLVSGKSLSELRTVLNKKQKANYSKVPHSKIASAAVRNAIELIAKTHGISGQKYDLYDDRVVFAGAGGQTNPTPNSNNKPSTPNPTIKPRVRKNNINIWI